MTPGTFEAVRGSVSALDVARMYGLAVGRDGKSLCPFHPDHRPSMTFKGSRFTCWSCGTTEDAVDLTQKLLNLSGPLDALRVLNRDFVLGLDLDKPPTSEDITAARQLAADIARVRGELGRQWDEVHFLDPERAWELGGLFEVWEFGYMRLCECRSEKDYADWAYHFGSLL